MEALLPLFSPIVYNLSESKFFRFLVGPGYNRYIFDSHTNSVKINYLIFIFSAWFFAINDFSKMCIYIFIFYQTVTAH